MEYSNHDLTPADLRRIEDRLTDGRTVASPLELDELKQRAMSQAAQRRGTPRGAWMKSRLALTLVIVLGAMMSGTGAGLAVSGSSGSGNAAETQYEEQETDEGNRVAGDEEASPQPIAGDVEGEQVAAAGDSGSLPFTGFVAIPLMVGGVALIGGGAFLRRSARKPD
jgi:hypothetical protein